MEVTLIEKMGTDLTVVNAARVSFGKKKTKFSKQDEKLIKYLARHNHWTPFGHCSLQFHIVAPALQYKYHLKDSLLLHTQIQMAILTSAAFQKIKNK